MKAPKKHSDEQPAVAAAPAPVPAPVAVTRVSKVPVQKIWSKTARTQRNRMGLKWYTGRNRGG
jgi:hypothetical protein